MLQVEAEDAQRRILDAGKSEELVAAFRCIAEVTTPGGDLRYTWRTSAALSTAIVCRTYAGAVFQLCHLINAADACGNDGYERFLFGPSRALSSAFKDHVDRTLARDGWNREGFTRTENGIAIAYPDGTVEISFLRIPFLAALFDFLTTAMSYRDIDDIFQKMLADAADQAALKAAMRAIERRLYRYLNAHLPSVQRHENFRQILAYLSEEAKEGVITIDDTAVLDFWRTRSDNPSLGDFRLFRSVFTGFVRFARALEWAEAREAVDRAVSFDPDRDAETGDAEGIENALFSSGDGTSPLDVLDDEPMRQIKFLTKRERRELAAVMDSGPYAGRLPLSLLRGEVFGARQLEIAQALRSRLPRNTIANLANGVGTATYADAVRRFETLRALVQRVFEAASFVALRSTRHADAGNVVPLEPNDPVERFEQMCSDPPGIDDAFLAEAMEKARTAFRRVSRKGFEDEVQTDPERIEAFRTGAGALLAGRDLIDDYLAALGRIDRSEIDLGSWFASDRAVFRTQFQRLYGERAHATDI